MPSSKRESENLCYIENGTVDQDERKYKRRKLGAEREIFGTHISSLLHVFQDLNISAGTEVATEATPANSSRQTSRQACPNHRKDETALEGQLEAVKQKSAALLRAVALDADEEVHDILSCPGVPVDTSDANGDTALSWSVRHGNLVIVEYLLKYGADPSSATQDGWSVLHQALQDNQEKLACLLVKNFKSGATASLSTG
ncbi:hypothetical protein CYMTET_7975 [Cymbomonas tetramitiformis]|uniref:Uncharacterized protein n=1 Tax=Cymbomonas tetramitiformis TaxID=36881 RepID=A0AAE0LGY5_9CHLO|nr:hypothetical protein CYMTET_7975 [Cymbomonas tetramitiformis]